MAANWWDAYKREDEEKPWWESYSRADESSRDAGGGRGFINPPMAYERQPERPAPSSYQPTTTIDYGDAATSMMGTPTDIVTPTSRGSILDRPYQVDQTQRPGFMLRPEFIDEVRNSFAGLPPEQRRAALTDLASGTDVRATAAQRILSDVRAEDSMLQREGMLRRGMIDVVANAPRVDAKARLGDAGPVAPVALPDVSPTLVDMMDMLPEQERVQRALRRDEATRGVVAADTGLDAMSDRANRAARDYAAEAFAQDNPKIAAFASGAGQNLAGFLNAVPTLMDFATRLVDADATRYDNAPGVDDILRTSRSFLPKEAQQPMSEAWDKGQFGEWLGYNLIAQAPQMANYYVAAMVPAARPLLLPAMGAMSAGQSFAEGDSSLSAVLKGGAEIAGEKVTLGLFDKSLAALSKLPLSLQAPTVQAIGKKLAAAGTAIGAQHIAGALEEATTQILQNGVDRFVEGKDVGLLDRVADSAVLGAFMEGPLAIPQAARAFQGGRSAFAEAFQGDVDSTQFSPQGIDSYARAVQDPQSYDPTIISPLQTARQAADVGPSVPTGLVRNAMPDVQADVQAKADSALDSMRGAKTVDEAISSMSVASGEGMLDSLMPAPPAGPAYTGVPTITSISDVVPAVNTDQAPTDFAASLNTQPITRTETTIPPTVESLVSAPTDTTVEQQFGLDKLRALNPQAPTQTMAAPRPQRIGGVAVETLTDDQLQQIAQDDTVSPITRRGAAVELAYRSDTKRGDEPAPSTPSTATNFGYQGTPNAPVTPIVAEPVNGVLSIPAQALPSPATAQVAGEDPAQRARASAQRAVDRWASDTGASPVKLNPAPAAETASVNTIAEALGSQFKGQIFAYHDPSPKALNGIAVGGQAFVNTASPVMNVGRTALHEFHHTVEQIAQLEERQGLKDTAAQQYTAKMYSIFDGMSEEGKRSYLTNYMAKAELSKLTGEAREKRITELLADPELRSEMVADFMGNRAVDKQFWVGTAKADPEGFTGFVQKWIGVIDGLLSSLKGKKGQDKTESAKVDKYVADLNKAKMVAREALIAYRKGTLQASQQSATAEESAQAPQFSRPQTEEISTPTEQTTYAGWSNSGTRQVPVVPASRNLNRLVERLDSGQMSPSEFEMGVRMLAGRMANVTDAKQQNRFARERERGADLVREKLLAARRRGEVDPDTTEFALWALDQNPAIATGLGFSVRTARSGSAGSSGDYNPASQVARVFKGVANQGTGVHEILHHSERMMPREVQQGVLREWSKSYSKALKEATGPEREALQMMLDALAGSTIAQNGVRKAFKDGVLDADKHYQLTNPSEYWAVNATRILNDRFMRSESWVGRARQWLGEMLQKAKGLFGLRSDAPVLRGLEAVLSGDGSFQSRQMLGEVANYQDQSSEQPEKSDREEADSQPVQDGQVRASRSQDAESRQADDRRVQKDGRVGQVERHVLNAVRGERVTATKTKVAADEKTIIREAAAKMKLPITEVEQMVRDHKAAHPAKAGWADLVLTGVKTDEDTGKSELQYKVIPYSFNVGENGKALTSGSREYEAKVGTLAQAMLHEVRAVFDRARAGDKAAQNIIAQSGWYKEMRTRLRQEFGGLGDLFADLLGATSPNTPVRTNWDNSVEALRLATTGEFDQLLPKWIAYFDNLDRAEASFRRFFDEMLEAGMSKASIKQSPEYAWWKERLKEARDFPDELLPVKANGKKFGFNGFNVARAMVDLWRVVKNADPDIGRGGTAPKAINFSGNLIGFRARATIDVWAARMLQRLSGGLRIPSMAESGVTGEALETGLNTLQFGFGQDVFGEAVKLIRNDDVLSQDPTLSRINDDDLQALVWFIEKEVWTKGNWTSAAGEGGSFEFEADLAGVNDRQRVNDLRKVADSSVSSTSEQREQAQADIERLTLEMSQIPEIAQASATLERNAQRMLDDKTAEKGKKLSKLQKEAIRMENAAAQAAKQKAKNSKAYKELESQLNRAKAVLKKPTVEQRQEMRSGAVQELGKIARPVDRFTVGLSIQKGAEQGMEPTPPSDVEMAGLAERIADSVVAGDPGATVIGLKAIATEGRYGAPERALDLEAIVRDTFDARPLARTTFEVADEADQDAAFVARVLRPNEAFDPLMHRPGVEIYFRDMNQAVEAARMMAEIAGMRVAKATEMGPGYFEIGGYTVIVDGRPTADAKAGRMGKPVGMRVLYMPEFEARYGIDERLKDATDEQLVGIIDERVDALANFASAVLRKFDGVSFAGRFNYEVETRFAGEYKGAVNAYSSRATDEGTGAGQGAPWRGRSVRESVAAATGRTAVDGSQSAAELPGRDGAEEAVGVRASRQQDVSNDQAFNRQLDDFLSSEPDPSQRGEGTQGVRRDAAQALRLLRAESTLLGRALAGGLAQNQRANLVGQVAKTPEDLAVLAQVYRDPRFETFRVFFTDAQDKIVSQVGLTNRLPGSASVLIGNDLNAYLKRLFAAAEGTGAKKFYLLHNHPSGMANASRADEQVTVNIAQSLAAGNMEFGGHVIIDTNQYSVISMFGMPRLYQMDLGAVEPPASAGEWSNQLITGSRDLIKMAKGMALGDDVTLVVLDYQNKVKTLTSIPAVVAGGSRVGAATAVRKAVLRDMGAKVAAVSRNRDALVTLAFKHKLTLDAIHVSDDGGVTALSSAGAPQSSPFPEARRTRVTADTSPAFEYLRAQSTQPARGRKRVAEPAVDQTDTPEFRRWFGDSKAVDERGEPRVMYHGTDADFSVFDPEKTSPGAAFGKGIYLTESPANTNWKRGEGNNVMPLYVKIENPLDIRRPLTANEAQALQDIGIQSAKEGNPAPLMTMERRFGSIGAAAEAAGFDGLLHYGPAGQKHVLVFKPTQVKSAIGNSGAFDPENTDIRASRKQQVDNLLIDRDELGRIRFGAGAKVYGAVANVANNVLDKFKLKPISPELSRAMRKMKVEVERAQKLTAEVANQLKDLPESERQMISDVIEGELKAGVIPPQRVLSMAASMSQIMSQQSAELVRLGMLTQETADRWDGKYLPRFYEQRLGDEVKAWGKAAKQLFRQPGALQGIRGDSLKARGMFQTIPAGELAQWEAEGWEVRDPGYQQGDPEIQVWRDFTRAEREQMGEIRDAMFRFVMGYIKSQRDIALGRLYEGLSETIASRTQRPGYVQVPKTLIEDTNNVRRYGKLAGKWVPQEVLDHLSAYDNSAQNDLIKMYLKGLSMWKEGKTVLNPTSHANNVLSNITAAHFAGVSYWDVKKYAGAVRDLVKGDPMVQEAVDAGLFLGTFNRTELIQDMPEQLKQLAGMSESRLSKGVDSVWNAMSWWLRKPLGKAYDAEDKFFRYVIFRDARKRGMGAEDAVDLSQQFIFNYDDLPKGARMIRDTALPFFSYTYKSIPMLARTALEYPWRFAAPAAIFGSVNAIMYAMAAAGDDDDWYEVVKRYLTDEEFRAQAKELEKQERPNLPPWLKGQSIFGTEKAIRLGMDDVTGLPLFLDASRIFPGGTMLDAENNAGGLPIIEPFMPNTPLFTIGFAMLGNRDIFRGTDIVNKDTDTDAEAAKKRADWLWKQLSPAIAAGNLHWDRAMNTVANLTGEPFIGYTGISKDGQPVQPKYSIPQTVGIKVKPIDLEFSQRIAESDKRRMIRDLQTDISRINRWDRIGAITPQAADEQREAAREKIQRLREGLTVDGEPIP